MQIDDLGGDTASVILVLTDGSIQDSNGAYQQVNHHNYYQSTYLNTV